MLPIAAVSMPTDIAKAILTSTFFSARENVAREIAQKTNTSAQEARRFSPCERSFIALVPATSSAIATDNNSQCCINASSRVEGRNFFCGSRTG